MFSWSSTYANQVKNLTSTGWKSQRWESGVPTSSNTTVTFTEEAGKLKFTGTLMWCQAYHPFTTIPGRVYRVKYKLSQVATPAERIELVEVNIFSPVVYHLSLLKSVKK